MKRSHSPDENLGAEASQSASGNVGNLPRKNSCVICEEFKRLVSDSNYKAHLDDVQIESEMKEHFPELHCIRRNCKLVPKKESPRSLTFSLLDGYMREHSACYGDDFLSCYVFVAIQKEVNKVFRDVSKEELSMYFRQWSTNHPRHLLMEEVRSTQTRRAVQDLCSVCLNRLKRAEFLDEVDTERANSVQKFFPEIPSNYKDMVVGFLDAYFLKNRSTDRLTLTGNCFGKKFETCSVNEYINDEVSLTFENVNKIQTNQITQDWFDRQLKLFEDIKWTAIDQRQEMETLNVIKTMVPEECKKDAMTMITWILDYILRKYYVGFVLACGTSKAIPIDLDTAIHDIILETFPELTQEIYQDCVTKWFESRE